MAGTDRVTNASEGAPFSLRKSSSAPAEDPTDAFSGGPEPELFVRKIFEQDPRKGCSILFRSYFAPLCSHAVRYFYSKEAAEDLVAQVFCDFWEKQLYQQVQLSYRSFLYRMVRNRSIDYLRKELSRNRSQDVTSISLENPQLPPEQLMVFEELFHSIQQTVEGMPPQCKKVFLLSRFEGKKNAEIAEQLQISQRTVETHISKALSTLREVLKNMGLSLVGLLSFLT